MAIQLKALYIVFNKRYSMKYNVFKYIVPMEVTCSS